MDEYMTVTLTLDNDEVVECAVLTIFSAGEKDYIALLPLGEFSYSNFFRSILVNFSTREFLKCRIR